MILDRYFFWNQLGIWILLSAVASAYENIDAFEFSDVGSAFASPRYTLTATPNQLQFFEKSKNEITNTLLKLKKSGVLKEKIIVAFSIACDWWKSAHENPELFVHFVTEEVIILAKAIVADEDLKQDCRSSGYRQPPPYFHNRLGSSAVNLHYDCVTVFKCGPFYNDDFSLMINYEIFEKTFPLHENNKEDFSSVSAKWFGKSALFLCVCVFFGGLALYFWSRHQMRRDDRAQQLDEEQRNNEEQQRANERRAIMDAANVELRRENGDANNLQRDQEIVGRRRIFFSDEDRPMPPLQQ